MFPNWAVFPAVSAKQSVNEGVTVVFIILRIKSNVLSSVQWLQLTLIMTLRVVTSASSRASGNPLASMASRRWHMSSSYSSVKETAIWLPIARAWAIV